MGPQFGIDNPWIVAQSMMDLQFVRGDPRIVQIHDLCVTPISCGALMVVCSILRFEYAWHSDEIVCALVEIQVAPKALPVCKRKV